MKTYLRLLFLASVALLVLGLLNDRPGKPAVDISEVAKLEQVAVLSGKLPYDPVHASHRLLSKPYHPNGFLENMRLGQETHQSRLLRSEIQVSKRIWGEISPELLQRKAYFIYIHSGSEIPS